MSAADTILVVNAGSSSIKVKLYRTDGNALDLVFRGGVSGIGREPSFTMRAADGTALVERAFAPDAVPDAAAAQHLLADWFENRDLGRRLRAVGHRVVHGGPDLSAPVLIDDAVLRRLEGFAPLAPLHQLSNLEPIKVLRRRRPDMPQVACFDTAFHHGHPELSDRFALPRALHEEGVRRYGFHGLSYEHVAARMHEIAPEAASGRVVAAHLGSGASLCALRCGRSEESTMGFTALDGIPMGTRSGALDPGVVLHLIEQKGMTASAVGRMLYEESGLLGLSGISNDVRQLLASPAPEAAMAVAFFCRRVAQAAASLMVTLGGLDALVFTAGIGENAPAVRARIVEALGWAGLGLDPGPNERNALRIDAAGSRSAIYVIPTDEERMVAQHTLDLLEAGPVPGAGAAA